MTFDYSTKQNDCQTLTTLIGRILESVYTSFSGNVSYGECVLQCDGKLFTIGTIALENVPDCMEEGRRMTICEMASLNDVKETGKYCHVVERNITGISLISLELIYSDDVAHRKDIIHYDRGVVIHFPDKNLVIDRGEAAWSEAWHLTWKNPRQPIVQPTLFDPEYPEFQFKTIVVPINYFQKGSGKM